MSHSRFAKSNVKDTAHDRLAGTRLGRLAQHIGGDKTRHDGDPRESVDSDSIGAVSSSCPVCMDPELSGG